MAWRDSSRRRFVAGETADDAIAAVAELNKKGITASLDLLGESVHNEADARAAGKAYIELLERIAKRGVDANVSLKLTQMGFDLSEDLCVAIVQEILEVARANGSFIRLDMESSAYTQRTIDLFERRLYPNYPACVGIVLQSMMRRTVDDVERAIKLRARVRLCKGAYLEPASVAFPDKTDVDANYAQVHARAARARQLRRHRDARRETDSGHRSAFANEHGIAANRFEFQMLYGVRRDLQESLVKDGWRVRVYVPFGTQWYPYLMRRLAERPANVAFITGNVMREMIRRK